MTVIDAERREEAEQAIEWARLAVKYDTENVLYFTTLVQTHVLNDDLDEAYRLALRMREMWPDEASTYRALGFVCIQRRAWDEAEEHSRRALALMPDSQVALINLGVALNNQGKREEAREAFLQAGRLDPTRKVFHENLKEEFPEGIFKT